MKEKQALLIIDVQQAFNDEKWGQRNNLQAEENIHTLLMLWRKRELPVIHIQHMSHNQNSLFNPSNEGFAFKELVKPVEGEIVIAKTVNSSFIGTNLEEHLRQEEILTVIITGLTLPHCVSTTTRMSSNLGFETYLVADGTASFGMKNQNGTYYSPEVIHDVSLTTLQDEFAKVLTTKELVAQYTI